MTKEIVKYHNSFNKIQLPSFNELELNLLFAIIANIKEKKDEERIIFNSKDLANMLKRSYRLKKDEINELVESLRIKFFKADFSILEKEVAIRNGKEVNLITKRHFNLFREFVLSWESGTNFVDRIELVVNKTFAYLIYDLTKDFTTFELNEFLALNGKYTKLLYRLLKQYRTQGIAPLQPMPMDEFRRIMDIPEKKYNYYDIERQILNPAIKELSEPTLFNQVPFHKLQCLKFDKNKEQVSDKVLKIDEKTKKQRRRTVKFIQFTFTPQEAISVELITKAIEIKRSKVDYKEKQDERKSYLKLDKNDIDTRIDILNAKFKNELLYSKELDSIMQVKFFDYDENNVIQLNYLNLNDIEGVKTIKMNYKEALIKLPIMIEQYKEIEKRFESLGLKL